MYLLWISLFWVSLVRAEVALQMKGTKVEKIGNQFFVSDSLVKKLSCSSLRQENVFTSLQEDAFTSKRHIPIRNWRANMLGQCWALSLVQRSYFYLLRLNGDAIAQIQQRENTYEYLLTLAGGNANATSREKKEENDLRVVRVPETNLSSSSSGLLKDLFSGAPGAQGKNFRGEIETFQQERFYNPSNMDLVMGDRTRSKESDIATMANILAQQSAGRMALLVIRAQRASQHVVLVKSVRETASGEYEMSLYDSNYPWRDNTLSYRNARFYANHIIGGFDDNPYAPVGVFLRDEDDMDDIQQAVYHHYKRICDHYKQSP